MGVYDSGLPGALMPWAWTVRGPDLVEYDGQVDGYDSAQATIADPSSTVDPGTWSLTLPASHIDTPLLLQEGAGVVIRPAGSATVIGSGPWDFYTEDVDENGRRTVTWTGPLDDAALADELAWVDPAHDLNDLAGNNPVAEAADVRTGAAETVLKAFLVANIGTATPSFRAARRWPWLTIPATAGLGSTVTLQGQFTSLLDLARQACTPATGIAFRILQHASGQLVLQVRARADRSADIVFSHAEGNLTKSTLTRRRPAVTQAIAASTTDTTRTFAQVTDSAAESLWLRRVVVMVDGNSDVIADLTDAAAAAIGDGAEKAGLTAEPAQIAGGPRYGIDYLVGDRVSAVSASGHAFSDVLTSIDYKHDAGSAATLAPAIGVNAVDETNALVPIVRALTRQQRRTTGR